MDLVIMFTDFTLSPYHICCAYINDIILFEKAHKRTPFMKSYSFQFNDIK